MSEIRKLGASDLEFATGGTDAEETTVSPGGHTVTKLDATHINLRGKAESIETRITFRGALVSKLSSSAISTSSISIILFGNNIYDTDSIVTSTSVLTVPSDVTMVRVYGQVSYAVGAGYQRNAYIYKNGGVLTPQCFVSIPVNTTLTPTVQITTGPISVSGGDTFSLYGFQDSGGAILITSSLTWFAMEIIQ